MFYGVPGLHARQALYRAISPADFCSSEMESHCEAQAGLSLVAINHASASGVLRLAMDQEAEPMK